MNSFEKPKDWNVAPKEHWVSGTPIGQSEIRMPNLGDPGAHKESSEKISFGDDNGGGFKTPVLFGNKQRKNCPPGTSSEKTPGVCIPNPTGTEASPESIQRTIARQFTSGSSGEDRNPVPKRNSAREIPKAPKGDPQIRGLAKEGVEYRKGKQS